MAQIRIIVIRGAKGTNGKATLRGKNKRTRGWTGLGRKKREKSKTHFQITPTLYKPRAGLSSQKNKCVLPFPSKGDLTKNICKGFQLISAQFNPATLQECKAPEMYASFISSNLHELIS